MVARALSVDFRYPRVGARLLVYGSGFNPDRVGIYQGNTDTGDLILDMDTRNMLPDEMKLFVLPKYSPFKVL